MIRRVPFGLDAVAAPTFKCTDLGNAEYFCYHFQDRVRYDHARGRYLIWRDHRWAPDDCGHVRTFIAEAIRLRLRDAADEIDPDARARLAKWAIASELRPRLEAIYHLAQSRPGMADDGRDFDAQPHLLGVPNGVVDLTTGELRDGERGDKITLQTAVPYDPTATCPRWEQFLHQIFAADDELIRFIWKAVGYSLSGLTVEQILFLLYGVGANGKTTFTTTIKRLLGDYGWNMPFGAIEWQHHQTIPNDLAALVGRRFVTASESNDGTRLNEARVKALTGGDPISARFLHNEFFTFDPCAKFWLSVNHRPVVRDDSHGFWRRLRLIPFTQTFPINAALGEQLAAEAVGILAWAVRGCRVWLAEGLTPPAAVVAATQDYEQDSDAFGSFVSAACELDSDSEVWASDLFKHYKAYADSVGLTERERLTATTFGRKAAERLAHVKTASGRRYRGIARKAVAGFS